jgi:hypothetical protein
VTGGYARRVPGAFGCRVLSTFGLNVLARKEPRAPAPYSGRFKALYNRPRQSTLLRQQQAPCD